MRGLVLDASAAVALVRGEAGAVVVRRHIDEMIRTGEPILVPGLFWLETVNVLGVRHRWSPAAIVEAIYELESLGLATTEVGRPVVLAVIDAVGRSGLTAYDAAYLVLAESAGARLLTADASLAAAAGDRAVLATPADGVAEEQRSYRVDPPWPAWKGASAYLAELRGQVVAAGSRDGWRTASMGARVDVDAKEALHGALDER